MRILISSVSYYPNISGVAVSTYLLADHLAKKHHQVFVIAPGKNFARSIEFAAHTKVTTYRLRAIPNPFRKGFHYPFMATRHLKSIIHKLKPSIVHLQDPTPPSVTLAREAHSMNIPVVVTNHFMLDYVLAYLPKPIHRFAKRYLFQKLIDFYNQCDAITCPTQTVADALAKNGVRKPIYALSNGVDIHRFYTYQPPQPTLDRFKIPGDKPVVLYLGRIDKDKSLHVLIESIEEVLSQIKAHFIIAGSGDLRLKYSKQLKKNRLDAHVTMPGPIAHDSEELVSLYQLATVFVIPSTIETQSLVTMEAMAAGKPIIAARAGALPELVHDGQNGFLFTPGNSHELAQLIIRVLSDQILQQAFGQKSLELIAKHELNKSHQMFEDLYSLLCTKKYSKNAM